MRLLRREALGAVSRASQVPAHELESWKRVFLETGERVLKSRGEPEERERTLARAKIGELTASSRRGESSRPSSTATTTSGSSSDSGTGPRPRRRRPRKGGMTAEQLRSGSRLGLRSPDLNATHIEKSSETERVTALTSVQGTGSDTLQV